MELGFVKGQKEEYVKKILMYWPFRYLDGVTILFFMLNDGVTLRQKPSLRDLK